MFSLNLCWEIWLILTLCNEASIYCLRCLIRQHILFKFSYICFMYECFCMLHNIHINLLVALQFLCVCFCLFVLFFYEFFAITFQIFIFCFLILFQICYDICMLFYWANLKESEIEFAKIFLLFYYFKIISFKQKFIFILLILTKFIFTLLLNISYGSVIFYQWGPALV